MKIFIISDSPYLYTGLARVNRHLIRGLSSAGHEVVVGGWGWDQLAYPLNEKNQWIYRDNVIGKEYVAFPLAKDSKKLLLQSYEVMKRIKCDVLLTLGDYWNFNGFHFLKQKLEYSFKWIAYYTIESEPINEDYVSVFKNIDTILVPSEYGKRVIDESVNINSVFAPYGVDHGKFYRLSDDIISAERAARNLDGKFRFINVSKNQHRKNLPAFLEAIKLAHEKNDAIVGYIHTNYEKKVSAQINLKNLVKRFGLNDVVEFPKKKLSIDIGCDDCLLNTEYNCSNALAITSVAEGFCLPILEAQCCGLPVVGTDCSTISELIIDKDFLIQGQKYYVTMEHEVKIINVENLAGVMVKMSKLEYDKNKYVKFSKGFFWDRMNDIVIRVLKENGNKIKIAADTI